MAGGIVGVLGGYLVLDCHNSVTNTGRSEFRHGFKNVRWTLNKVSK